VNAFLRLIAYARPYRGRLAAAAAAMIVYGAASAGVAALIQPILDRVLPRHEELGQIITAILAAVFFTILLVAGNTMAQAVRERTGELGVLKAIGFTDGQVLGMVISESMLIAIAGGAIGLALGWLFVSAGDPTRGALPVFFFPPGEIVTGIVMVVLLGIVTGAIPAIQAMRLNAVEALRKE